jgi:hypothetical protein
MPEDNNPQPQAQNPKPLKEKKPGRKKFIFLTVVIVILVLVGAGAFSYLKIFNKSSGDSSSQKTSDQVKLARVYGKSDGKVPYAPIDEENVVSRTLDKNGGVLQTTLSNGVKAYLVIPEGSVIMDASASLLPYKEMPTQKSHGGLSGDYGFGLQVSLKSVQVGVGGFLVFDVTGGKATKEAAKKAKVLNRCDPRYKWFNPFICARQNKVSAKNVADKNVTVVTPIHNEKYKELVFTNNTIPVGIDGLIVMSIGKGDVYIPQKLDKDLTKELVDKTLGKYMNSAQRLEAAALALEWGIDLNQEKLEIIADTFGGSYQEDIKALYVYAEYLKQAEDKLKVVKNKSTSDEDEEDAKEIETEDLEDLITLFTESQGDTESSLLSDAKYDTKEYDGDITVGAAAALGAASELGVDGASTAAAEAASNMAGEAASETDLGDAAGEAEAAQATGDEAGAEQAQKNLEDAAADKINDAINDPNSSIGDLLDAAALAQLLGLDDLADQALDKIKEKLEDMLDDDLTKEQALNAASLAQLLGFEALAEKFLQLAGTLKSGDCDLVNKTLKTYGINKCD